MHNAPSIAPPPPAHGLLTLSPLALLVLAEVRIANKAHRLYIPADGDRELAIEELINRRMIDLVDDTDTALGGWVSVEPVEPN